MPPHHFGAPQPNGFRVPPAQDGGGGDWGEIGVPLLGGCRESGVPTWCFGGAGKCPFTVLGAQWGNWGAPLLILGSIKMDLGSQKLRGSGRNWGAHFGERL